jgi:hypothetical protein
VEAWKNVEVFALKPIAMISRGKNKPALCSDDDDKTVILTGSSKVALYRFLPVIE